MKDDFDSLNDYELLYMIRTGDDMAFEMLLEKYEHYIQFLLEKQTEGTWLTSKEDLKQECYILLVSLAESFREDLGCSFLTYLVSCVRKRISNYQRVEMKNRYGFKTISLDSCISEDVGALIDVIDPKKAFYQPEYECRYTELIEKMKALLLSLPEKEKIVWDLMNRKLSYEEAAQVMGVTRKQFDNLRLRLKKKIVFCIMKHNDNEK